MTECEALPLGCACWRAGTGAAGGRVDVAPSGAPVPPPPSTPADFSILVDPLYWRTRFAVTVLVSTVTVSSHLRF